MRLMLLRHGKADKDSRTGLDADRPLMDRGRAQAEYIGERLRRGDDPATEVRPERILTSGARRADETAALVAAAVGMHVEGRRELVLDQPIAELLDLIRVLDQQACSSALLVGHNPQMERAAAHLIRLSGNSSPEAGEIVSSGVSTGQLVAFDVELTAPGRAGDDSGFAVVFLGTVRADS